ALSLRGWRRSECGRYQRPPRGYGAERLRPNRMAPVIRGALLRISLGLLLTLSSTATEAPTESQIQAAFLLNFTKFIEWPAGSLGPSYSTFNICVMGNNPFGTTLDQVVAGEMVYGRKVVVQKIDRQPEPGFCQIVFTGTEDSD